MFASEHVPHVASHLLLYSCGQENPPAQASAHVGRSSHDSRSISDDIRSYLSLEWQRKLDEQDHTSTPVGWLKEHPGMSRKFTRQTMPSRTPDVPCQANYYDCGLFLLTFMDFWTHTPPDQIKFSPHGTFTGKTYLRLYAGPTPATHRHLDLQA